MQLQPKKKAIKCRASSERTRKKAIVLLQYKTLMQLHPKCHIQYHQSLHLHKDIVESEERREMNNRGT